MICSTNNPAARRYMWRFSVTMLLYLVFLVIAVWTFVHRHPTGPLAWLLAFLPALAILGQTVTWGFLENFLQLRHLDLILVYPIFCALSGIAYGLLQLRYR